jgi:hypothetical protein
MIELVEEQAGGLYDPYAKAFRWIAGLPVAAGNDVGQRLVVAHELAHALQDRSLDLVERFKAAQGDLDAGFGFVAVMEGTAMVAGMAYAQDATPSQLGDIGPFLRKGYMSGNAQMPAFARSPVYVQEVMIGPYVEGSTFVHEYLADNPEATMASLFDRLPKTSEQTLHYDKYLEPDLPVDIDLSTARSMLPPEWSDVYANSLGEFEIRTLCRSHTASRDNAGEIAAGWDGFRIAAFEDQQGDVVVMGASCWDSDSDADEFEAAFRAILADLHDDDAFEVRRRSDRLSFVTGIPDGSLRRTLLEKLIRAAGPETGEQG